MKWEEREGGTQNFDFRDHSPKLSRFVFFDLKIGLHNRKSELVSKKAKFCVENHNLGSCSDLKKYGNAAFFVSTLTFGEPCNFLCFLLQLSFFVVTLFWRASSWTGVLCVLAKNKFRLQFGVKNLLLSSLEFSWNSWNSFSLKTYVFAGLSATFAFLDF